MRVCVFFFHDFFIILWKWENHQFFKYEPKMIILLNFEIYIYVCDFPKPFTIFFLSSLY